MRTMPPWEANEYFKLPVYSEVVAQSPGPNRLLIADPMRVGILFGVGIGGGGQANVAPSQKLSPLGGYSLNTTGNTLFISHNIYGPLAQSEWWGNSQVPGGVTVSITELTLNRYPQDDPDDTKDVRDYLDLLAEQIKALGGRINGAASRPVYPVKESQGERSRWFRVNSLHNRQYGDTADNG